MCGLAAVVAPHGSSPQRDQLATMLQRLAHRGPDDVGVEIYRNAALGHRRLSIIDLLLQATSRCVMSISTSS